MRVLVAGGAGFIGTHLCETLLEQGHEVHVVDNESSGSFSSLNLDVITAYKTDVEDFVPPDGVKFDQIYNLAAVASPKLYQLDPIKTINTNIKGTENLLNIAKETGASFLQTSTSEVYGDPCVHPQPESYAGNVNTQSIRSSYDEGKRAAETYCYLYAKEGVDVKIARIFNTYGPKMSKNDGRVVSNFICNLLENKPLVVYGDGSQTRSLCFVDDMVDGLIKLMNSNINAPINLGSTHEVTIKDLAHKVCEIANVDVKLDYAPLPECDPLLRRPDITAAKINLGWEPKVSIDEGLKKTFAYFKEVV